MTDGIAARPTDAEIAAAKARANVIVWGTWWVAMLALGAAFRVHDRWTGALIAGVMVGLMLLQHHAIKAARLLGHGRRRG